MFLFGTGQANTAGCNERQLKTMRGKTSGRWSNDIDLWSALRLFSPCITVILCLEDDVSVLHHSYSPGRYVDVCVDKTTYQGVDQSSMDNSC